MPTAETGPEAAERLPLTAAQSGIWYGQQLDPASPAYNTADLIDIRGPLDPRALVAAIERTLTEAEGLRTRYGMDETGPWQVIVDDPAAPVRVVDVSGRPDPVGAVERWAAEDLARPVDLATEPVSAQVVFRVGADRHLWYQRIHHIAIDGYGCAMLHRRVAELYTRQVDTTGATGASPSPDAGAARRPGPGFAPLRPVIDEDAAYQASPHAAAAGAFWRDYLTDAPEPVTPGPPGTATARTGLRTSADLPPDALSRLRETGGRTSVEALIAAVGVWLYRVTGADEVVLGLPVMGRLGTPARRVPATVMNVVPIRLARRPGDRFPDVVDRVATQLDLIRPHQRYRHERLRRDRGLVGAAAGRLFGPVVNVLPFGADLRFGPATATVRNLSAGPVEDLSLAVRELPGGGARLELDAHPERYDDAALAGLADGFAAVLAGLAAGGPVDGGPVGGAVPGEDPALLAGAPLPATPDVVTEFLARAAERPDTTAVRHGTASLTYSELVSAATALADRVAGAGAGPGSLVAVALPRGAAAVTAILGTLLTGAAYLPLDPRAPRTRTADLVADAGPTLLLADPADQVELAHLPVPVLPVPAPTSATVSATAPAASALVAAGAGPVPPDELAYVSYTSGSTGRPKGVAISRGALAHFVAGARELYALRPEDRMVQFAPLHFDASVEEVFGALCSGAALVVRGGDVVEAPVDFLAWAAAERVTLLDLPTAYWHEVVHALHSGAARLPATLRGVIIGGEAAQAERVAQWRAAAPPDVTLWNTYGPTEATVVATAARLD